MNNQNKIIEALESNLKFQKSITETLEKKLDLLMLSISSISGEDQEFMRNFEERNNDSDLFDFFNKFMFEYGRADKDGICMLRMNRSIK